MSRTPVEESWTKILFLLLAKTLGIACIIGSLVSILGWQYLHWSSSRHFSDGLFWAGAAVAVLGYYVYRSELNGRRTLINALRLQPTGSLSMQERTKRWLADAATGSRLAFHFILVTLYLIVFSALVWILF